MNSSGKITYKKRPKQIKKSATFQHTVFQDNFIYTIQLFIPEAFTMKQCSRKACDCERLKDEDVCNITDNETTDQHEQEYT